MRVIFARRSKAKAKPQRRESASSSTRTMPIGERTWTDVEPGEFSISDYEVSKKLIHLLRHGSLPRENDGAIEFWRIKDNFQKHFPHCHHWSDEKWKKSMAGGGQNKKRYQYCTDSSGAILYLRALQGHSGRNLIGPSLQDNVDLVHTQFSSTAVETSAPQVGVSLPPYEEYSITKSIRNRLLQVRRLRTLRKCLLCKNRWSFRKFLRFLLWTVFRNKLWRPLECFHKSVSYSTPLYKLCTCQFFKLRSRVPPPRTLNFLFLLLIPHIDEESTFNTSSTSTSSNSTSTISNAKAIMLDNLTNIEKEVERAAMLTKRMMETPLPEPPLVEPPMVVLDRTSAKRRRRTRYTPLPGIMEHAVYLAPSAWPPIRHA